MAATTEAKANGTSRPSKLREYCRCKESQDILSGSDPNVVCLIRRRFCSNVVVYRCRTLEDDEGVRSLHPKHPIDIFWLKMSPDDVRKHRQSGKTDDRVELGRLERKFAYGVSYKKRNAEGERSPSKWSRWTSRSKKGKKGRKLSAESFASRSATHSVSEMEDSVQSESSVYSVSRHPVAEYPETEGLETIAEQGPSYQMIFNALKSDKSMQLTLRMDAVSGRPGLFAVIPVAERMVECRMKEIFVALKAGRMGVLNVSSVTVCATRCDNGKKVERVLKRE